MKTNCFYYLVIVLFLIYACKQGNEPILEIIKQLPNNLQPTVFQNNPLLLKKDTISLKLYKIERMGELCIIDSIHNERWLVRSPKSKNDHYLTILKNKWELYTYSDPSTLKTESGFFNSISVQILYCENDIWKDCSKNLLPPEVINLNNNALYIYFSGDSIMIKDALNFSEHILKWKDGKYLNDQGLSLNFAKGNAKNNIDIFKINFQNIERLKFEFISFYNEFINQITNNDRRYLSNIRFPFYKFERYSTPNGSSDSIRQFDSSNVFHELYIDYKIKEVSDIKYIASSKNTIDTILMSEINEGIFCIEEFSKKYYFRKTTKSFQLFAKEWYYIDCGM